MEPINGLERLTDLLRTKAVKDRHGEQAPKDTTGATPEDPSRLPIAVFEQQMQQKIKNLQHIKASPSALRHAVIESILIWEFGEQLRNEPKFITLVNQVRQHAESEQSVKNVLEKFIRG